MLQAIHGVGIDWTFAGEAVEHGGFLVRAAAVSVSLGGMMVTALMLGLVSGASPLCISPIASAHRRRSLGVLVERGTQRC